MKALTLVIFVLSCSPGLCDDLPVVPDPINYDLSRKTEETIDLLNKIIIPKLQFRHVTLPDMATILENESRKYDTNRNGVRFIVLKAKNFGLAPLRPDYEINEKVTLRNLPLMESMMMVGHFFDQIEKIRDDTVFFMPPFFKASSGLRDIQYSVQKLRIRNDVARFSIVMMDDSTKGGIVDYKWCEMNVSCRTGETLKLRWKPMTVAQAFSLVKKYNDFVDGKN